jgi:diguanylate cyclase (GGDEF)-like protein
MIKKMKIGFGLKMLVKLLLVCAFHFSLGVSAGELADIDSLLAETYKHIATAPQRAEIPLAKLQQLESKFSKKQKEKYYLHRINLLAYQGRYKEQVALILSVLDQIETPNVRANYLYNLSDGYTNLGEYEKALIRMNEGILLLPKVDDVNAKMNTLQAALSLFVSLRAYDEALTYADRIYKLDIVNEHSLSKCVGLAENAEINFLSKESALARKFVPSALHECGAAGSQILVLLVKTLAAIDLIDSGDDMRHVQSGLSLLKEFATKNETSDYVTQLEEAIARAYLRKGDLAQAERFGLMAYKHAQASHVFQILEKTNQTMGEIKKAQGQIANALAYFEAGLALKNKVLDDQLHKNLAYQRAKFDIQDKANQLALSEQKNKTLQAEKIVQQGKNQNLLLLITLSLILLTILGGWLARTLRQKNIFKVSSQIDGLTQISNRAYFIESAKQTLKNPANSVTLILFDMDHFKSINDTFGHSTGDWVLRTVCNAVKSQLRPTDLFGRLGGEEFAICLVNLSEQGVLALAERCRAGVAAIDTKPSGAQFLISASFGIATHGVRGNTSFEDILAAADKALYFSKNGGRNLVSVFQ